MVLCVALLLIGIRSAINLPVISFPVIESSSIAIVTAYPGASAETVQGFVTEPIERVASSVPGLDYVESVTTAGTSTVTLWLRLNQDTTKVLSELSTRLSQIRFELPEGTEDPSIEISRADTPYASFYLGVLIPPTRTYAEVSDIIQRDILPRLSALPNVQRAMNYGLPQAMRIWLDPWRMAALSVDANDIYQTLQRNNVIGTFGQAESRSRRINLQTNSEAKNPEDFANMLIRREGGTEVRLGDVATVERGTMEVSRMARYNQDQVVFIPVYPEPGTSEILVGNLVYEAVAQINETLPPDLELTIPFDNSRYMRDAVKEIFLTLGETVFLVGLVVIALMGSVRSAAVPLLTIPISILGAMAAMSLMGFSLNLLTILAVVLSVGLVVDDAIVVVENVARHLREGMSRREAALASSRRLLSPIIAMTITLGVVYAPIGFVSGLSGVLFREFAFTLAVAVLISGFVAMTLSPIMSAWVCPDRGHETRMSRWVNDRFELIANRYGALIDFSLRWRWQLITAGLFFTLLITPLYLFSLKELAPIEDQSAINLVVDSAPESSIAETLQGFSDAVEVLMERPETTYIWQALGPSGGYGGHEFVPPGERELSTHLMLPMIRNDLARVPSVRAFPATTPALPTAGQFDVEVVVTASDSAEDMRPYAQAMVDAARSAGLFLYFETSLRMDLLSVEYRLDKDRLADLGMTLTDLTSQIGLFVSEGYVTRYDERGRAYRVIPMIERDLKASPETLLDTPVTLPSGERVPFGTFATLERNTEPRALTRFQQKGSFKLFGGVIPGYTKEQALTYVEELAATALPPGYRLDYTGESREIRREGNTMLGVLGASLVMVFLVLALQFNSFRDPLIILLGSAPLALFAAMVITFTGFTTINIYSQVGLITLVGLISKNAILIVEFANQAQVEGLTKLEAIRTGSMNRLRPVLMTTGATVFGHFPLVLVEGAGAEARNSIGFILVIGMMIGTLFTLVLLPAIYALLASDHPRETAGSEDDASSGSASEPSQSGRMSDSTVST
ncbi:MAG: multidrug efflux protein [Cellvibrionales bacterium TMED122]|nr:MAG: multidrug efflux protein [Cellvibrionales bacterium TMED122]